MNVALPLQQTLNTFNIDKDVIVNDKVLWIHRTMDDMDIYFLTNQSDEEIAINPSFRVEGLKPQLWDAVTGEIRAINDYDVENGRTTIPLFMEKDRSWFVIFTNQTNESVGKGFQQNLLKYKTVQTIDNPWFIEFENKKCTPGDMSTARLFDWSKSVKELLKYYSGTANYSTTFNFKKTDAKEVFIDLGKVGVIATVSLNGINVGTSWMAPYRLKITDAVKDGENTLEIKVVNTWRNRITGDGYLPDDKRTTSISVDYLRYGLKYDQSNYPPLTPSGLMGDVVLQVLE